MSQFVTNTLLLSRELDWLRHLFAVRNKCERPVSFAFEQVQEIRPPQITGDELPFSRIVCHYKLTPPERAVLALALANRLYPNFYLDLLKASGNGTELMSRYSMRQSAATGSITPTAATALYLLAGDDLATRLFLQDIFSPRHFFAKHQLITLAENAGVRNPLLGDLNLTEEAYGLLTTGRRSSEFNSSEFPAQLIETSLEWDDLVLDSYTMEQVLEIRAWLRHGPRLLADRKLGRKITPGFVCLMHGPSGTGKTLTACLLGKVCGRDVFRLNIAAVSSRYVGDAEKALDRLFDRARRLGCIILIDECESLFSRRVAVSTAQDRFVNQEVSFLLQKIESHPGLVLLASNMRSNIDEAFARRFQSIIYFPVPERGQRLTLWSSSVSQLVPLAKEVDLERIADTYELSGGSIVNVLRSVTLAALEHDRPMIDTTDLEYGITRELQKEGRSVA